MSTKTIELFNNMQHLDFSDELSLMMRDVKNGLTPNRKVIVRGLAFRNHPVFDGCKLAKLLNKWSFYESSNFSFMQYITNEFPGFADDEILEIKELVKLVANSFHSMLPAVLEKSIITCGDGKEFSHENGERFTVNILIQCSDDTVSLLDYVFEFSDIASVQTELVKKAHSLNENGINIGNLYVFSAYEAQIVQLIPSKKS